jgi:hypothetical protein
MDFVLIFSEFFEQATAVYHRHKNCLELAVLHFELFFRIVPQL